MKPLDWDTPTLTFSGSHHQTCHMTKPGETRCNLALNAHRASISSPVVHMRHLVTVSHYWITDNKNTFQNYLISDKNKRNFTSVKTEGYCAWLYSSVLKTLKPGWPSTFSTSCLWLLTCWFYCILFIFGLFRCCFYAFTPLYSMLAHGGCFKVQLVQYDSYINTTVSQMSMCRKHLEANKHLFNTCVDSSFRHQVQPAKGAAIHYHPTEPLMKTTRKNKSPTAGQVTWHDHR